MITFNEVVDTVSSTNNSLVVATWVMAFFTILSLFVNIHNTKKRDREKVAIKEKSFFIKMLHKYLNDSLKLLDDFKESKTEDELLSYMSNMDAYELKGQLFSLYSVTLLQANIIEFSTIDHRVVNVGFELDSTNEKILNDINMHIIFLSDMSLSFSSNLSENISLIKEKIFMHVREISLNTKYKLL